MNLHDNDRNIHESKDVQSYFERLQQQIRDSEVFLLLLPTDEGLDMKVCIELGVAVLMDKPILVLQDTGRRLPDNLSDVMIGIITLTGDSAADAENITSALRGIQQA